MQLVTVAHDLSATSERFETMKAALVAMFCITQPTEVCTIVLPKFEVYTFIYTVALFPLNSVYIGHATLP